jgi:predicted dithiol-disulfide oxidoreductase (DUF899 family)
MTLALGARLPGLICNRKGKAMTAHKIGTRAEWQAARNELAKLEAQQAEHNAEVKRKRLELPWVPVEKPYEFDTETGRKTLPDLFEGRSQLLAYDIMFGPTTSWAPVPGAPTWWTISTPPRCISDTAT